MTGLLIEPAFRLPLADGASANDLPVLANSVNIMQDRVTRSRMAGDPPEITLNPLLPDFAFMDFHRAEEAIAEGRRLIAQHEEVIRGWVGTLD